MTVPHQEKPWPVAPWTGAASLARICSGRVVLILGRTCLLRQLCRPTNCMTGLTTAVARARAANHPAVPPPSPEGTLPGSGGQPLKLHGGGPDTGRAGLLPPMLDSDQSARANRNQPVPRFEPTLSGGNGRDTFCGLAAFDRSLTPIRSLWSIDSRHRTGPRYRPSGLPRSHNNETRPGVRRAGQSCHGVLSALRQATAFICATLRAIGQSCHRYENLRKSQPDDDRSLDSLDRTGQRRGVLGGPPFIPEKPRSEGRTGLRRLFMLLGILSALICMPVPVIAPAKASQAHETAGPSDLHPPYRSGRRL